MTLLLAYGLNHLTASVALREQVAFAENTLPDALSRAKAGLGTAEIVILSTCNRTEFYCCFEDGQAQEKRRLLDRWLSDFRQIGEQSLQEVCYCHANNAAVQHIIRVACGLDSMVLGESQVLGQLKRAWHISQQSDHTGMVLNQLGRHVITSARQIRSKTEISRNPVSLAYIILKLTHRIFDSLKPCTALLIGAGEMTELIAKHLTDNNLGHIMMANRTLQNIESLAYRFHADVGGLESLQTQLTEADIVISATGAARPLISKEMVKEAMHARKNRPMLMVDLAVPRDIEPETRELANLYLYSLDDLQSLILENSHKREMAAREAEQLVESACMNFANRLKGRDAVDTIRALREQTEAQGQQALAEALTRMDKGEEATEVLTWAVRNLTNKWLHAPTTALRDAVTEDDTSLNEAATRLHGLKFDQSGADSK